VGSQLGIVRHLLNHQYAGALFQDAPGDWIIAQVFNRQEGASRSLLFQRADDAVRNLS
jgi:hypothetical protein